MRRFFLRDAAPGDVIEDVYVITGKQLSTTSTGKYFIKGYVSDRTCQMVARMWNATKDIFSAIPESGFIRLRGRIENYQSNLQLVIEQLWAPKDGTYDVADEQEADVGQLLLDDFDRHTKSVRQFVRSRFGRTCPGE